MNERKKENGITLIALVITIIVLLILAGVAISMLSGENGILKKATEAKTKTDEASIGERIKLAVMGATEAGTSKVDKQKIADELNIDKTSINGDAKDIVLTMDEKTYNVKNGKVKEVSPIKEIDNILDEYFQENGSSYKCRYGYVTGIEFGTTVEKLQGALPTGYSVKTDEDPNVKTGLQIVNSEDQEVARTVIFGDTDCNGVKNSSDRSLITNYVLEVQSFDDYQIIAMDANHDSYINNEDYYKDTKKSMSDGGLIQASIGGKEKIEQSCYAISKEQLKMISRKKIEEEVKEKLKAKVQGTSYEFSYSEDDGVIISGIDQATTTVQELKQVLGNEYYVVKRNSELKDTAIIGTGATLAVKDEVGAFVEVATLE